MPEFIVAVLTGAGGAHLDAYFTALALTDQVSGVVVADPSGSCEAVAKKLLGSKLKHFERDHKTVLDRQKPGMAIVSMEAVQAPPVIHAALEANCHVLAEKPACVRIEDFEPLVRLADMKHRYLMLAMANRLRGTVQAARKMIRSDTIGKIYGCELHLIADQTRLKDPNSEDSAAMALRFDNGSFGTITSGYYLDRGKQMHVKIWGSKGWLQLELDGPGSLQWYENKESPPQVRKYDGPADDGGYTPMVQACVRASLDGNAPVPITGAQSLHVLKTVFACYHAAETGRSQLVA